MTEKVLGPTRNDRQRIYVRSLPVRVCHWIIFFCFLILVATGMYIAHPYLYAPTTGDPFVMGTVRFTHFYTAIVFDIAFGAELFMILIGGRYERYDQFIPMSRKRWRSVVESSKFYLFLRRMPPMTVSHDGLDGIVFVIGFVIEIVIILTGFAMWSDITSYNSPLTYLSFLVPLFGGLQTARFIHHVTMWAMIVFVLLHVIRVVAMAAIKRDGTVDSIVSGYRYVSPREVAEFEEAVVLDEARP